MENKEKKEKKANNVHEILIEIKGKDWEEKLNEISEGKAELKDFIGDVENKIKEVLLKGWSL